MHISTRKRIKETSLNMTPMIDVVFLLITFFMLVTEITRQDDIEDLQLPDVRKAVPDEDPEPNRLILNIDRRGSVFVSGIEYKLSNPSHAAIIKGKLRVEAVMSRRTAGGVANRTVLVRADRRTPFRYIRQIITMCVDRDIGIWRLAFGTLPFESREQKAALAKTKTGS